jgi:hypothetical protein
MNGASRMESMTRNILKALGGMLIASALLYVGDYAVLRYRVASNLAPYGNVTVLLYYAVPLKTGKMEYDFQSSQQEACANSLFPHMGYLPCWYARKHTDREIKL